MYINQNLGNATGYTDEGLQRELENLNNRIKIYQDQFNAAKRAGDADAMEENQAEIDFFTPSRDAIVAEINRRASLPPPPPPPPPTPIVIVKSARQIELEAQLAQAMEQIRNFDRLMSQAEDRGDFEASDFYQVQQEVVWDKVNELNIAIQAAQEGQNVFVESLPAFEDFASTYSFFDPSIADKTPIEKAKYFNYLKDIGKSESLIFEAIDYWVGKQTPQDIAALKALADELKKPIVDFKFSNVNLTFGEMYSSTFGRQADAEGLMYWKGIIGGDLDLKEYDDFVYAGRLNGENVNEENVQLIRDLITGPILVDETNLPITRPTETTRGPDTGPGSPFREPVFGQATSGGNTGLLIAAALAALTLLG